MKATGILLALALILVIAFFWGTWMSQRQEDHWRDFCGSLHARFVQSPEWMCVRDGQVVYIDR